MAENVQDILWMVVVAMLVTGYGLIRFVWRTGKRDSEAKRRLAALRGNPANAGAGGSKLADPAEPAVAEDAAPPRAEIDARASAANRLGIAQTLQFIFLPGRKNRVLALEVSNFVTAAAVSEAESRVAGQLGIEPLYLVAQRRLLLAGAIRSIFIEFEQRGNPRAAVVGRLLDDYLHHFFATGGAAGASASSAALQSAYAIYGKAERPKVALAFFRSLRGDAAGADDMRGFPDFLLMFDNYAKEIERFLRPRIARLGAR